MIASRAFHPVGFERGRSQPRAGFTLIELVVILVIMSIIAATVIPVMDQSTQARQGASRDEVVRTLEFARGLAMSGGNPIGVTIDLTDNTLIVVRLNESGDIENITDPIDGGLKVCELSEEYAGVLINSFSNGDGQTGDGTVWFDFQATPHTRNEVTGSFDSEFVENATITLSTGTRVVVHAGSGLVEDQ